MTPAAAETRETTTLRQDVERENAAAHDACAAGHDASVPYISRPATRRYYWDLITAAVQEAGVSFQGASVLELGCGTGTFTDLCLRDGATRYVGVDLSPNMIAMAQKKTADARVSFEVCSLQNFSAAHAGEFDIILSSSFIHHLVDLDTDLAQVRALLTKTGVYVGIHEPIVPKKRSVIENIDGMLQIMTGFSHGRPNLLKRLILTLSGDWRFDAWGMPNPYFQAYKFYVKNVMPMKNRQKSEQILRIIEANERNKKYNLVDFQLNKPFQLSERCSRWGVIKPYVYLCFPELKKFARQANYEMLVMKKES